MALHSTPLIFISCTGNAYDKDQYLSGLYFISRKCNEIPIDNAQKICLAKFNLAGHMLILGGKDPVTGSYHKPCTGRQNYPSFVCLVTSITIGFCIIGYAEF